MDARVDYNADGAAAGILQPVTDSSRAEGGWEKPMHVTVEDVVMGERKFSSKSDPAKSAAFADVYRDLRRESVFHGERGGMPGDQYAFNTFGAHFAEVEVNVETGRARVLKYAAAQDSGQIINKLTAESQVVGGVTEGLSAGLFEERVLDDATGNPTTPNLRDYKIATSLDIPEIMPIFVGKACFVTFHGKPLLNVQHTMGDTR